MGEFRVARSGRMWVFGVALTLALCLAPIHAQGACEGFTVAADSCPPGIGLKGCCDDPTTAQWCDDGVLCSWDCSQEATATVCGWEPVGPTGHYICRQSFVEDPSGQSPSSCEDVTGCPCVGIQCGFDYSPSNVDSPGCFCGVCADGLTCNTDNGTCVCVPACAGKQCGADGCGGQCGLCADGGFCNAQGLCVEFGCEPDCWGKECGADGCGDVCGQCSEDSFCQDGICFSGCGADCTGRDCGDDGCGGSCGECFDTATCTDEGKCELVCVPSCDGRDCGDDGCAGLCGVCTGAAVCSVAGICSGGPECSCAGRVCGSDGCGNSCGDCFGNTACNASSGQCEPLGSGEQRVCPPGTRWNRWVETCAVIEETPGVVRPEESGGCAGAHPGPGLPWWAACALALLCARAARRRAGQAVPYRT